MGRPYTATFALTAATTVIDWFEILTGSNAGISVHGIEITQTTEIGDAQEEMISYEITRGVGAVTSGSGGTTTTAVKLLPNDAAASTTIEVMNTTRMVAGSGSLEVIARSAFNVRAGLQLWFPPEMRPMIFGGQRITVGSPTTPADSIGWAGTIYFSEDK